MVKIARTGCGGPAQACLANDRLFDKVVGDVQSGQTLGVKFTPTLFINEQNYGNPGAGPTRIELFCARWGGNRLTPHRLNSQDVVERKTLCGIS